MVHLQPHSEYYASVKKKKKKESEYCCVWKGLQDALHEKYKVYNSMLPLVREKNKKKLYTFLSACIYTEKLWKDAPRLGKG